MSNASAARNLRAQIDQIQPMTRFVLATLALASGVYTYLGVRSLLDGSATLVFFSAIIYSAAVSVGIYGFWSYLIRFVPEMRDAASRLVLMGVMALGCLMIVAMSSWLNAAALAGSAAVEQHLAETLEDYTGDLDQAHGNALGALSLLPDIQRASDRFARLADDERQSGALTGTSGSGSVVQLLTQMSAQMDELHATILNSRDTVSTLFEEGQQHLATMRGLVSAPGPVQPRSDRFAEEAVALAGVIASLEQTSIAPSVARAASDLSAGFIAPVADGNNAELAGRQDPGHGDRPRIGRSAVTCAKRRRRRNHGAAASRRAPIRAAVSRRSRASLCLKLPAKLGRRDLHRPSASRARRHHERRLRLHPP